MQRLQGSLCLYLISDDTQVILVIPKRMVIYKNLGIVKSICVHIYEARHESILSTHPVTYRMRGDPSLSKSNSTSTAESEGGQREEEEEISPTDIPMSSLLQAWELSGRRRDSNRREAS